MMTLDELRAVLAALPPETPGNARVYMEHEHPYDNAMARAGLESVHVERDGIYLAPTL
jgi:hypothetical protein